MATLALLYSRTRAVLLLSCVLLSAAAGIIPLAAHPPSALSAGAGSHAATALASGAPLLPGTAAAAPLFEMDPGVLLQQNGPAAKPRGLTPADLWDAYRLPSATSPSTATVAIVDAYRAPTLEHDVAVYRRQFRLPPCTVASGCLRILSARGRTDDLPAVNAEWSVETSLDAEMVSAVCPRCHIVVLEADTAAPWDLDAAVTYAGFQLRPRPTAISISWGSQEPQVENPYVHLCDPSTARAVPWLCESWHDRLNADDLMQWDIPGIAITVASGDNGYEGGVIEPADSRYVIAVGGTTLKRDPHTARGWTETAWGAWFHKSWSGAGSGCSAYIDKPSYQNDGHCAHRTVADVSFVADPQTGLAVYDTTPYYSKLRHAWRQGWITVGGTSAGAPAVAGIYGLANNARFMPGGPGRFLYEHGQRGIGLWDITYGSNMRPCRCYHERRYLAFAGIGYDGPTGNGSPDGIAAF